MTQITTQYRLITFYKFVDIPNPHQEVIHLKQYLNDIGIKGRIYVGEEGINAQLSANNGQIVALKLYLDNHTYFNNIADIDEKATKIPHHMFPRMIVKYRPEIVTLGKTFKEKEIASGGQRMSIQNFKEIMDQNKDDYVVIDMRNSYEYKLGHFKNAIPAGTVNFRELGNVLDRYRQMFAGKKIITYCTGGIRCEKATVMLREAGLNDVYQLDGGVIKYVNKFNDGNRLGNLYTFDDRVSTKVGDENTHTAIGECIYSGLKTDNCENCRYTECNARIICRRKQYKRHLGFCSQECFESGKNTLLIKNVDRDNTDYKNFRNQIKKNPSLEKDIKIFVSNKLNEQIGNVIFNHKTSQKEELIFED